MLPSLHLQQNHTIAKQRISFSRSEAPIASMGSVSVQQKFPSIADGCISSPSSSNCKIFIFSVRNNLH
ncbi:hypothetical protein NC652_008184 [Populus alba x Populus x berolinensis]|nr:hypothetical protein NC652_008184 [Populus alba x Populus x berolinensis]